jgi:hypothetical protein
MGEKKTKKLVKNAARATLTELKKGMSHRFSSLSATGALLF